VIKKDLRNRRVVGLNLSRHLQEGNRVQRYFGIGKQSRNNMYLSHSVNVMKYLGTTFVQDHFKEIGYDIY